MAAGDLHISDHLILHISQVVEPQAASYQKTGSFLESHHASLKKHMVEMLIDVALTATQPVAQA